MSHAAESLEAYVKDLIDTYEGIFRAGGAEARRTFETVFDDMIGIEDPMLVEFFLREAAKILPTDLARALIVECSVKYDDYQAVGVEGLVERQFHRPPIFARLAHELAHGSIAPSAMDSDTARFCSWWEKIVRGPRGAART
jgi:hypothetical protein